MSVVIETTLGDITVDLYLEQRPVTCLNFLKLCKMKYYNFNLFHSIRSGFIAQTGDPTGEGSGGESVFGLIEGPNKRFFSAEKLPKIRHTDTGLLSMVCTGDMMVGSQFFFTLAPDLDSLDAVHCVIGEVAEGHEVLRKLNDVICDESHRPYQDVRITHTVILEDPFNDPAGLRAPSRSPSPSAERLKGGRIAPDEEIDETQGKSTAEIQELIEEKEAKARATILEIVGDLPDADIAPPENVLFVCKLNPVTTDEDLEIIFSRFGKIVSCEVIRDKKSGDSLQYAFIEFDDKKSCEDAYFKMDNVLIDDRRIHVDFSQSVSKIKWLGKGRGVKYFNDSQDSNMHDGNAKHQRRDRRPSDTRGSHNERRNLSNKRYENKDRHRDMERHNDRQNRDDRERNTRSHKERSRSPSKPDRAHTSSKSYKSHKSDNQYSDERNHHYNNKVNSRRQEKDNNIKEHKYENHKSEYQNDNLESDRGRKRKQSGQYDEELKEKNHKYEDYKMHKLDKEKVKNHKRSRHIMDGENKLQKVEKRDNFAQKIEARTPSPSPKKKSVSKKSTSKKVTNSKKKRKHSTSSSDSDSSDSSSSSATSSSSEDNKKKKSIKRRKKSASSSSSSDSSDSSSSTSSSSDSSSSTDSEHNKRKRKKKQNSKVQIKKTKKKL